VSAPARRIAALYAMERGVSQRRACALMEVARSSLRLCRYCQNALVVQAMRRLSKQYPRYGSRRIRIFFAREEIIIGKDRCSRLWSGHGLQVPKKRGRKRVAAGRPRPLAPIAANMVWSYDFVFDACANGQQLRCLTVADEYTRESLAIDVAGSIRSARVIEVLARLISVRGAPRYLRSDNGPEFVSVALL
jgi:putative transposase